MINIFIGTGFAAALTILHLSGPDEPTWLPLAVIALALYALVIISWGFNLTITREQVAHDEDEHRDNAI